MVVKVLLALAVMCVLVWLVVKAVFVCREFIDILEKTDHQID